MLDWIFIIILVMAIIFLILAYETDSLTFCGIDIVLWLTLSRSVYSIEVPYQAYNVSSEQIETGIQVINTQWIGLDWLFMAFVIIMMIFTFVNALEMLQGKKPRKM